MYEPNVFALLVDAVNGDRDAHSILADLLEETGENERAEQARLIGDSADAVQLSMQMMPYRDSVRLACGFCERVFRSREGRRLEEVSPFVIVHSWLAGKESDMEINRACRVLSNKRLLSEFTYVFYGEQTACAEKLAAAVRNAFLVVHHERNYSDAARTGRALEYADFARADAATVAEIARIAAALPLEPPSWLNRRPAATTSGHGELQWQTKRILEVLKRLIRAR